MSGNATELARAIGAVRWDDLPSEARQAASVFLLDALAVGVSGSREASARTLFDLVSTWGAGDDCSVLGRPERLPAPSAAYQNAFQVHCQEFDCLHEPATVHAMAVLSGALLAYAQPRRLPVRSLLLATVVGVEVAVRLGLCASEGLRFFRPATAGLMGATAALARLEGFDEKRFLNAWGFAYSQLAGTMQAHVEGSVALPLQVAAAARAAVNTIDLAGAGFAGPHDVLDGPFGYFRLFERSPNLEPLQAPLGERWRVTELSHKPFPTGRAAHGSLQALSLLMSEHEIRPEQIETITAEVPPLIRRLVDRPYGPGLSVNTARLCLPYLVAVYLRRGTIDSRCFSAEWRADASLAEAAARVGFKDNGVTNPNALSPQSMSLLLKDGRRLTQAVPHTLGSPECPLDRSQRLQKVAGCLAGSGREASDALPLAEQLEKLLAVDSDADATELLTLLTR